MTQTEFPESKTNQILTYKGFEFKVGHIGEKFACVVPSFNGGCVLAGTLADSVEKSLIRTTSILNNAFIQPAINHPRVGDLFGDEPDTRLIIVKVEKNKIKMIPLKDATVFRHIVVEKAAVHPYLIVKNKVDDLSNEVDLELPGYVILEDGVLQTNNFPMDVFVWKGLKDNEVPF